MRLSLNVLAGGGEDTNEPPYRISPSGDLTPISANEDDGLIPLKLSDLEYSPGKGEEDDQTSSIPLPPPRSHDYTLGIDADNNNAFVEVIVGNNHN